MGNAENKAPAAYQSLLNRFQEIGYLNSSGSLLSWDQETYLPESGVAYRAKQSAYFSARVHELATAPEVGDWLSACEDHDFQGDTAAATNIREWRHDYERDTLLSTELVSEFKEASSLALAAWQQAKQASNFAVFAPHFEKLVELSKQKADAWGYEEYRYDALLEEFERGAKTSALNQVFAGLKKDIVQIAQDAIEHAKSIPDNFLEGEYPVAQQKAFNREVAEAVGFDFDGGRIDTAAHPFCSGLAPGDTRLTNRYNPGDFTSSFFGVLHEAGHGLYEQGLPVQHFGAPAGESVSLGIHESQSRLWENHVGRSAEFWNHWLPRAADYFPHLSKLSPEQMTAAVNRARRSHIRVESDEATYDLHIMLRFEIEKRLIEGELKVADVPAAWNEEFRSLFDIDVRNDAEGCLQDIHWSMGIMGYFPTYSLGNLNASQLFASARKVEAIRDGLQSGSYGPLLEWLRQNVHARGRQMLPGELMESITGEPVRPDYHLAHLRERYLG